MHFQSDGMSFSDLTSQLISLVITLPLCQAPILVHWPPVNLPLGSALALRLTVPAQHVESLLLTEAHHLPLLLDPEGECALPRPDKVTRVRAHNLINYSHASVSVFTELRL